MSLSIPPEFAKKRITRLKCMNCRYEFNLVHSKYGTFRSFKDSNFFIATCPNCRQKKQDLYVLDHEYDPMIPTYLEPSFKKFYAGFVVAPLIADLAIYTFILFYPVLENILLLVFIILAIVVVFSDLYIVKKSTMIKMWKPTRPPESNTE